MVLDVDLSDQIPSRQHNLLTDFRLLLEAFHGQQLGELRLLHLHKIIRQKRLADKVDHQIKDLIRERNVIMKGSKMQMTRSVLSLSLEAIDNLTDEMVEQICDNLKTFLFAGHETTGVLLQWIFYDLSKSPYALKALRNELDKVLGSDADPVLVKEQILSEGEDVLSRLIYTSAVIKETLRL